MHAKEFRVSLEEMEEILREETVGYLGLSADGQPYVVPLNYAYVGRRILFHCGLTGKKLEYLKTNPRVCFTVGRQREEMRAHAERFPCFLDSHSVICVGRARVVEDLQERQRALTTFQRCYQPEAEEISPRRAEGCCTVEIEISEMTGRKVVAREYSYWRYVFDQ